MTLFDPPPFSNLIPYGQKIYLNQFPDQNHSFDCRCRQPSTQQLNQAQAAAAKSEHDPGALPYTVAERALWQQAFEIF